MTAQRFGELMGALIAATAHRMTDRDITVWFRLLGDVPDAALEQALIRAACECKAFPSVALIREYAAGAEHGETSSNADVWPHVLHAVRHFGIWRKSDAKAAIPAVVWKAIGGDAGWEHLCDMEPRERSTYAAQFRDRWRELRSREDRDRRLPEQLRPRLDDSPVAGLPEPAPERAALPAPPQPGAAEVEAARLKVFKAAPEPPATDDAVIEQNRQRQIEAARLMAERRAAT